MHSTKHQIKFKYSYIPFGELKKIDTVVIERKFIAVSPEVRIAKSSHSNGSEHCYLKIKEGQGLSRQEVSMSIDKSDYMFLCSLIDLPAIVFNNYIFECNSVLLEFRECVDNPLLNFGEVKLSDAVDYKKTIALLRCCSFFVEEVTSNPNYNVRNMWINRMALDP